jgi:hypothetical protein
MNRDKFIKHKQKLAADDILWQIKKCIERIDYNLNSGCSTVYFGLRQHEKNPCWDVLQIIRQRYEDLGFTVKMTTHKRSWNNWFEGYYDKTYTKVELS